MGAGCVRVIAMLARPLSVVVLVSIAAAVTTVAPVPGSVNPSPMTAAAEAWLDSLSESLREQGHRALDDKERTNWHFVPRQRKGVSLKEMDANQRRAAHALLRSALSSQGYLKAKAIMELEAVLFALESRPDRPARHRDPELYWFMVFGEPSTEKPWAWRVEGHHLSLNFTVVGGRMIAFAPAFFGANPGEVRSGRHAGLRVLSEEEDLARALLLSLTDPQRETAKISAKAPRDIILAPGRAAVSLPPPHGVSGGALDGPQRDRLKQLVSVHARVLRDGSYDREMARMETAGGIDKLHFGWAGSAALGEGHYYRVVGPTLIIEYDNVQNAANHVHVVWRDPENDFGGDVLRRHRASHK